jgi:hypothetical protein
MDDLKTINLPTSDVCRILSGSNLELIVDDNYLFSVIEKPALITLNVPEKKKKKKKKSKNKKKSLEDGTMCLCICWVIQVKR